MKVNKKIMIKLLLTLSVFAMVGCSAEKTTTDNTKVVTGEELVKNKNARTAIALALDKEALAEKNTIISNNLVAKGVAINYNGDDYVDLTRGSGYEKDLNKSKEYWENAKKELGFNKVTLVLGTANKDENIKLANSIKQQLEGTLNGLSIDVQSAPMAEKLENDEKNLYDITMIGWAGDYADPLAFIEPFGSTGLLGKLLHYKNDDFDNMIKEAKQAVTIEDRWDKAMGAEKILLEEVVTIPIAETGQPYKQKDYVKDRLFKSIGSTSSDRWTRLENGKKEFSYANSAEFESFNCAETIVGNSLTYAEDLYDGLVRTDKDNKLIGGVADKWETSEDGKTIIFNLREDVLWSNGDKVTAHDFVYAWKRILEPKNESTYSFLLYDIVGAEDYNLEKSKDFNTVGIKALDDKTLEIKLNNPAPQFLGIVSTCIFYPLNEKFVETQGDNYGKTIESTLFNGPFVPTKLSKDELVIEKNDNYWDKDNVNLDKITMHINKDLKEVEKMYEEGNIDYIVDYVDISGDDVKYSTTGGVNFLNFNIRNN